MRKIHRMVHLSPRLRVWDSVKCRNAGVVDGFKRVTCKERGPR